MVDIAPKPAAAHADPIVRARDDGSAERTADEERGKVHAGVDRELQRAPQPAVHLHEDEAPCREVALAFDHRDALPTQLREQRPARSDQLGGWRDALAVHTHAAFDRFFPQPPMSERCQDRKSTRLNSSHVAISYAVLW